MSWQSVRGARSRHEPRAAVLLGTQRAKEQRLAPMARCSAAVQTHAVPQLRLLQVQANAKPDFCTGSRFGGCSEDIQSHKFQ